MYIIIHFTVHGFWEKQKQKKQKTKIKKGSRIAIGRVQFMNINDVISDLLEQCEVL